MSNSQSELSKASSPSSSNRRDEWTVEQSARLYNVKGWGEPYFAIDRQGNVTVTPQGEKGQSIKLLDLIESLTLQGIDLPLSIHFPEIMADRLARLYDSMERAIASYDYQGSYQGVFPLKCNQNRQLIADLVDYGKPYRFGLEAGSKAELAIALAFLSVERDRQPLLICNGYKDREYIETALLAAKVGHQPIVIVERPQELDLLIEIAQELDIEPVIGVRAKLSTRGIGRWGNSTGERAKFGLTVTEILQVVYRLRQMERLNWLQLLHFHVGSQISAISVIKDAIREASQIYVQLVKLGARMGYFNVGGGLAVDYNGSKTNAPASKNYNMQNYANDIVAQVKDACDRLGVVHPILVSESGRAIASHQSVLVFDVLSQSQAQNRATSTSLSPPSSSAPLVIRNFWSTYQGIDPDNLQESYHDAVQFKQEALSLFNLGYLSLIERSQAESLYWACCQQITEMLADSEDLPDELATLPQIMASTYYVNLSIFRSAPDSWAIEQLFPIMPLHRLQQKPEVNGILADITCDSDGRIDRFIDRRTCKNTLELHTYSGDRPYYLGMFLVGAYQETMGNLHNLFGATNAVQIKTTANGYQIDSLVKGDAIAKVLNSVQYNDKNLLETMKSKIEVALQNQSITPERATKLLRNYTNTLDSYTYLKI